MSAGSGDQALEGAILDRLAQVGDPCMEAAGLGISVVDLGLVRELSVSATRVDLSLGLTEPGCAFTHALVVSVEDALAEVVGDRDISVTFSWREPWTEARMTPTGRRTLQQARRRGADLIASSGGALPGVPRS